MVLYQTTTQEIHQLHGRANSATMVAMPARIGHDGHDAVAERGMHHPLLSSDAFWMFMTKRVSKTMQEDLDIESAHIGQCAQGSPMRHECVSPAKTREERRGGEGRTHQKENMHEIQTHIAVPANRARVLRSRKSVIIPNKFMFTLKKWSTWSRQKKRDSGAHRRLATMLVQEIS